MAKYPPRYATTGSLRKLYQTWADMRRRCSPTDREDSRRYYFQGIRVCDEWQRWPEFAEWAFANGWEPGLEIDRRDNANGYAPDNCRFVTGLEQNRNRDLERAHRGIREGQTRRWAKPFQCVETGEVFKTQIEAYSRYGVERKCLRLALRGEYKQAGGYRWAYMEAST